jgi:hypothetical protein
MVNLVDTFFKFYPIDEFRKCLLSPEKFSNPDVIFQDCIASMLSLSGFSVIILGKKGHEKAMVKTTEKTPFEVGSADLLAYDNKKKLCFIDCTIRIPDESKIRKLQTTISNLSSKDDINKSKVFGLVPSSKNCADIRSKHFDDVFILERNDLEWIMKYLSEGKIDDARRKFWFQLKYLR